MNYVVYYMYQYCISYTFSVFNELVSVFHVPVGVRFEICFVFLNTLVYLMKSFLYDITS